MRSEGFPFIVWGSGGWTRVRFVAVCRRGVRAVSSRCARGRVVNSVPWGLASGRGVGRVACAAFAALCHGDCCWACRVGVAVSWGLPTRASSGCRRVLGIADTAFVWVLPCLGDCRSGPRSGCRCVLLTRAPLCHGDCCWVCRAGATVPCGLLVGVSRGWRCAMGIPGGRVACVALCHGNCYWACRVGGAVPWGLLLGVSRGWRCAMEIAAGRVACVALCHGDCCWACRGCGAVPWGLLLRVSRGCRCAMGIAGGRVAWVALCLRHCRPGRRLGGAVS